MEKDEFREVMGVYRDLNDTMKRIELLLGKIGSHTGDTKECIQELNKHFKNGFKRDIVEKLGDNIGESCSSCIKSHTKEINILYYKLIATSGIIVAILSLAAYLASGGKVKLF